jgi:sigma-B regulation protein RsbU (phosphoserine phosphatase)
MVRGRDAVKRVFHAFFSAFPDCEFEFLELMFIDDRVVETLTIHGHDTGGFLGQPATGKAFRLFMTLLYTIADNAIVNERRVYDRGGLLLQLATDQGETAEATRVYEATLERTRAEHDLRMAAQIQRALLPVGYRKGAGFEVASTSLPCRAIGGDFIDYFDVHDGSFGFVLGDVAGKGPAAALLAGVMQGIFTVNAHRGETPAARICEANDALVRRGIEARFATAVYGVLSRNARLTYCNAGHNPPVLIGTRGVKRLEAGGLIVGAFERTVFGEESIELEPGDTCVVFSDGVTEARNVNGDEFGEERVMSCVTADKAIPPVALLEHLVREVQEFSAGTPQGDDQTILVLRYSGGES